MNNLWVIRIVVSNEDTRSCGSFPTWGAALGHAGIINPIRQDEKGFCFDIYPPRQVNGKASHEWANREASRMITFGINAVAVLHPPES